MKVTVHRSRFGQEYWLHHGSSRAAVIYRFAEAAWQKRHGLGEPWEPIVLADVPDEVLEKHVMGEPA